MATAVRPTAIARIEPPAPSILERKEIAALTTTEARAILLPRIAPLGISFELVLSEAYLAIQKNPAIGECTPMSQLHSVARILEWGLTIGEKAFIVPFKGVATPVRSYQGDIEMIVHAGGAKSIDAAAVWEGDAFEYELGSNAWLRHTPLMKAKEGRKIIAGYAVADISGSTRPKIVVMPIEEIEKIRKEKSKSWYTEKVDVGGGRKEVRVIPIERIEWYVEKTPVHKITKQLPTSPRMAKIARQLEEEIITDAVIEDAEPTKGGEDPGAGVRAPASVASTRTDAPAPATDPDGVSTDIVDAANDHKLPGGPKNWNGQGGKPIGTLDSKALGSIRKWCVETINKAGAEGTEANPALVDTLNAIDIVLAHRAKDQTTLPLGEPTLERKLEESVAATKPAGSGGPVEMPAPGKIEDAVRPKAAPAAAPASGPSLMQLAGQAQKLLEESDRPATELAELRKQYDAATTREQLQALVADLSFPV